MLDEAPDFRLASRLTRYLQFLFLRVGPLVGGEYPDVANCGLVRRACSQNTFIVNRLVGHRELRMVDAYLSRPDRVLCEQNLNLGTTAQE